MGMRKKELRVVGKPSAEKHCVLLDPRVKPEDDTFMKETEDDERSEAGIREEAGLSQGTEKEELHVTGSPIGSGMTKKETPGTPKADSESGRSMVETLGVLAIMGLLAIGGIIGYRYAVDKYLSNELWNNVKWISVQVMTDGSLQGMSSGDEMTVKSFSGDSDLILKRETAIGYSVRTGNLRESTCRQIRRSGQRRQRH